MYTISKVHSINMQVSALLLRLLFFVTILQNFHILISQPYLINLINKSNSPLIAVNYVDIDFTLWLSWCLAPLIVTFLLPLIIVVLLYLTALIFYVYKLHWRSLKDTFETGDKWEAARKAAGAIWDAHGWIWHGKLIFNLFFVDYDFVAGYEVEGLENIPKDEPALLIYYHGAIPIDIYYFLAKVYMHHNRVVHTVGDNFLFRLPGI